MRLSFLAAAAALALAIPAAATQFDFTFSGSLGGEDALTLAGGGPDLLTDPTGFTFRARFDDSSPDLVEALPFPGFKAFSPIRASIEIGGKVYRMVSYASDPANGIGVSLFDTTQPIFPGLYGVGFIANPLADGAGIVGDFSTATPAFSVEAIGPTVFGGFNGAGYNAGFGCAPGFPPPCVITPLTLFAPGGIEYALTIAGRTVQGGVSSASITAVPEPASWALLIAGFAAVGAAARMRRAASGRAYDH